MRTLFLFLALVGCGSGGDDAAAKFVGTWQQSGTLALTCDDGSTGTLPLAGNLTITRGSAADLLVATPSCSGLRFTVAGAVASIEGGQTCTVSLASGTGTARYTTWSLSSTDGRAGTSTTAATLNLSFTDGTSGTCTTSGTTSISKL